MKETGTERPTEVRGSDPLERSATAVRESYAERLRAARAEAIDPADAGRDAGDGPPELPEGGERLDGFPEVERQLRDGLERTRVGLERWAPEDRSRAEEWFGSSEESVRRRLIDVYSRIETDVDRVRLKGFEPDLTPQEREGLVAYVYPDRRTPTGELEVHVGPIYAAAEGSTDSKAGILVHEMSHFTHIGATEDDDDAYGQEGSRLLAKTDPERALRTADNIEYFYESYTAQERQS